ncbi:MAG: hypothetical protein ABIL20_03150 [candidate division WOR-3 bacterium]
MDECSGRPPYCVAVYSAIINVEQAQPLHSNVNVFSLAQSRE